MQDRNLVALPSRCPGQKSAQVSTLTVLKRFEFESQLLRSGVLVVDSAAEPDEALFFVRGAPSSIEQTVGLGQVPPTYRKVYTVLLFSYVLFQAGIYLIADYWLCICRAV